MQECSFSGRWGLCLQDSGLADAQRAGQCVVFVEGASLTLHCTLPTPTPTLLASEGLTEDLLKSAGSPNCAPDARRIPEVAGPLRLPGFSVCMGESGSSDPRSTMTHVFPPRTDRWSVPLPLPLGVGRLL